MDSQSLDPTSDALSYDILSGMHEWRLSVRPPHGRPLPPTVRPVLIVVERSFAALASRATQNAWRPRPHADAQLRLLSQLSERSFSPRIISSLTPAWW